MAINYEERLVKINKSIDSITTRLLNIVKEIDQLFAHINEVPRTNLPFLKYNISLYKTQANVLGILLQDQRAKKYALTNRRLAEKLKEHEDRLVALEYAPGGREYKKAEEDFIERSKE